ncbi:hypothetical protein ISN44_As01g003510, partial [Arabidopsis suecica]
SNPKDVNGNFSLSYLLVCLSCFISGGKTQQIIRNYSDEEDKELSSQQQFPLLGAKVQVKKFTAFHVTNRINNSFE